MYRYNRRCSCDRCRSHSLMWPIILITVGVLFLVQEFAGWRFDFWDHTWPLLLIVIGGVILWKRNASIEGHVDSAQQYVVMQQPTAIQVSGNEEVHNG